MTAPATTLGVLFDFPEEGWPSMDLAASMLVDAGVRVGPPRFAVEAIRPAFLRLATRLPVIGGRRIALNADRVFNRMWRYPRLARAAAATRRFDLFHVADHSYAQVVHALPDGRAGVFCHDLDAFRCLLEPACDPRPGWFRAIAGRILAGLRRAAVVFHATAHVREEIVRLGAVDPDRLVHAPLGVAPGFGPDGPAGTSGLAPRSYVLHVGSCIPRKRIDLLLEVFAALRRDAPALRLVQVGGTFTPAQRALVARHGLGGAVVQLGSVPRPLLAALYRGAAALLQPSEAEGFGLPVLEALACGTAVVASEIPALREVAADAALYCPVADVEGWVSRVRAVLDGGGPPRPARLARAALHSWDGHARTILAAYARVGEGGRP